MADDEKSTTLQKQIQNVLSQVNRAKTVRGAAARLQVTQKQQPARRNESPGRDANSRTRLAYFKTSLNRPHLLIQNMPSARQLKKEVNL